MVVRYPVNTQKSKNFLRRQQEAENMNKRHQSQEQHGSVQRAECPLRPTLQQPGLAAVSLVLRIPRPRSKALALALSPSGLKAS